MASPNDIKKGTVIKMDNDLMVVATFQRVSPGKGSSFVRTKLRSLSTGNTKEVNFKSSETLEFADVAFKRMQYIFGDANSLTFMDGHTYEQIYISRDMVGDDAKYLKEGLEVVISTYQDKPIAVELPMKIEYSVAQTEPAVKGDSAAGNVLKDATMDNGLLVRVPIFIKEKDTIRVNTGTGEYVERVN